jgi:hypothetical protein
MSRARDKANSTVTNFASTGIDDNADANAITIDSGENVLVGTTNTDPAFNNVTGQSMAASGQFQVTRDGGTPALMNRKSDNGTILDVRKDGTTVGSISTSTGVTTDLILDPRSSFGSGISGAGLAILPMDHSQRADNHTDLGEASNRWKDLYLSGNLYLGGTGSSNALDDYEEGTFTPRFQQGLTSAGYSTQTGVYTKIGRQVICSIVLRANSGSENGDHIYIGGLPFIARNATAFMEGAFFTLNGGFWTSDTNTSWLIRSNETNLAFYRQNDAGAIVGTNSSIANNLDADVRLIVLYTTA